MDQRLLILETSQRVGHVAVAVGDQIVGRRQLDSARRHARDLAPAVHDLLREQGWRPPDIHAVIVSRGPGSYTGLRVGIMSAKAFAYATGCALVGVDTFAAIALQSSGQLPQDSMITVIADAQQDKLYSQTFTLGSETTPIASRSELVVRVFADWLKELPADGWVSGPAVAIFRSRFPSHVQIVDESWFNPRPESLLQLGLDRLARGESDSYLALEPLYLRPSSAEENWKK